MDNVSVIKCQAQIEKEGPCLEDSPWYCIVELPTGEELARNLFDGQDIYDMDREFGYDESGFVISENTGVICRAKEYWNLLCDRNRLAERCRQLEEKLANYTQ